MKDTRQPMRYALLAAALMQLSPAIAETPQKDAAAKKEPAETAKVCDDCPDPSGKSGWIDAGIGLQSDEAYRFGRYTGYENDGAHLNASGEYRYRGKANADYLDIRAEDLGLESRRLTIDGGRQGQYGIALEYDQIPNFRESNTRSPFSPQGDGLLALPAGWIPAGTTTAMPTLAGDLARTPLQTERDRLGVRFSLTPGRNWELNGHFRREEKDGTLDKGATFAFNQTAILPVPVNYQTDDFGLAVGYQGERMQAKLAYAGSLFENGYRRIAWDNPYASFPSLPDRGQMAEAPDNQFHQISAVLGYQWSETTRLAARLARGRMTQDQAFLPYTINPAVPIGAPPVDSLNGQVDTTLVKVDIYTRPSGKLRLDASYTYSDRDNKTAINTYEHVVTDSFLHGTHTNQPFSFEQNLLRAKAAYRLPADADLSFGFDHDKMSRTYQQVEETQDQTVWAKLRMRPGETVETTLKLSHANRDASPYTPNLNEHSLMRAHNLADRERGLVGIEATLTPTEKLSLGVDFEYLKDDYNAMYLGLREASGMNSNINLAYTFSDRLSATAYYDREQLNSEQAGSAWIIEPGTPWLASDKNLTQTVGFGVKWVAIPKKLDVGVDIFYADYTGEIRYAGAPALPDLGATLTGVGAHAVYTLKDNLSLRVGYRYERYKESDWAKNAAVDSLPTLLSLGAAPQNYDTHLVTLSVRYEFK